MKRQNDPSKNNPYRAYIDNKSTYIRQKEVIESFPKRCWWIRDYLRGVYGMNRSR